MEAYLNTVKRLADDLTAKGLEISNKLVLGWVLSNLKSVFDSFTSTVIQSLRLTSEDTSIDVEPIFSSLLDEARRLDDLDSDRSQVLMAQQHATRHQGRATSKRTSQNRASSKDSQATSYSGEGRRCHFCNKLGHIEARCWKKYPEKRPDATSATIATSALAITDYSDEEEIILL